jgi:hypothetical protein
MVPIYRFRHTQLHYSRPTFEPGKERFGERNTEHRTQIYEPERTESLQWMTHERPIEGVTWHKNDIIHLIKEILPTSGCNIAQQTGL